MAEETSVTAEVTNDQEVSKKTTIEEVKEAASAAVKDDEIKIVNGDNGDSISNGHDEGASNGDSREMVAGMTKMTEAEREAIEKEIEELETAEDEEDEEELMDHEDSSRDPEDDDEGVEGDDDDELGEEEEEEEEEDVQEVKDDDSDSDVMEVEAEDPLRGGNSSQSSSLTSTEVKKPQVYYTKII